MANGKSQIAKRKKRLVFLVGPTAVGKSDTAVILAKKINAEIISCDSMQIYKGMDIITSKAALTLRRKIPHHLVNIISPNREYDVYRYHKEAIKKIREVIKRGKTPLFAGGTGLYVSILLDGIFSAKAQNKTIRRRLYKEAENRESGYLYERLKKVDPAAAAKIHPHDTKRIIRALEVFEITGKSISELQKQRRGLGWEYEMRIFCLNIERDRLYRKIDERVNKMFAKGLISEVKKLLKSKLGRTASYAIGIRELRGYFAGAYDLEEAKRLIKRNTRQYAKRQLTWFRKDKRIEWIEVGSEEKPAAVANSIVKELKNKFSY